MKRFTFITVVFILVVSIFLVLIQTRSEDSAASIIQTAFSATGAKVVTSEVYMRGKLATEACDSTQERQGLLAGIISNSGGNLKAVKPDFSEVDTDNCIGTQLDYIMNKDRSIHASVLSERQGSSMKGSLVSVSLINTSQKQELVESVARLQTILEENCESTSVNICITGSMEGTLDEGEVNAICDKILESAGANKVEGLQEEELVSVSAFSPTIGNSVRVNGKRINLNVAVRYNAYEGKTYIWLASPVITTEY